MVYREGVEPSTRGLRDRCSTTELSVHYLKDTLPDGKAYPRVKRP